MAEMSVFLVPIVLFISLFTFMVFAVWFGTRQKEREAFYKSETLRRISESSGEGAKQAIDLLREEERLKRIKTRESIKLGGLINIGVGIGLTGINALSGIVSLSATAPILATMLGLAVAIDYALFIVYRFRDEIGKGASPEEAATTAAGTARLVAVRWLT